MKYFQQHYFNNKIQKITFTKYHKLKTNFTQLAHQSSNFSLRQPYYSSTHDKSPTEIKQWPTCYKGISEKF